MDKDEMDKAFCCIEIPVQWGDMDALKHVNNTVYLRWVESVRIEFFKKLNAGNPDFGEVGPILAWQDCKYIFPVTFPDTVAVTYDVTEIKNDRIICKASIYSKRHKRIAAIAKTSTMAYNYKKLEKAGIPEEWTSKITQFYGDTLKVSRG